jgi:WD40 repeat protein
MLICSLIGHSSGVTGVILPLSLGQQARPPAIIVSGSLDGNLRMWDVEKRRCIYQCATNGEVLGLGLVRQYVFYHYSRKSIVVWNLNKVTTTFSYTRSQVTHLIRVSAHDGSNRARIVTASEDGSIRVLHPTTGSVLLTCFPAFKESYIIDIMHDVDQGA